MAFKKQTVVGGAGMVLLVGLAAQVRGAEDAFVFDGLAYRGDVEIKGISGSGKLVVSVAGADKGYELSKIKSITLAVSPRFNEAEAARDKDAKAAAAAYKKSFSEINKGPLKLLAELRAVAPTEADGKFTESLACFLDVYATLPTDAIWEFRPTKLPETGSTMLKEASDKLNTALAAAKNEGARKNLKTMQLDILSKAGDVEGAQRLAKELATGVAEEPAKTTTDAAPPRDAVMALADLQGALNSKEFDAAIKKADALLASAAGDTAIQAYQLKARAFEGKEQWDLAAGTLLRIPAHYPSHERNAALLWQAADLQKRAGHLDAAKALLEEIVERYPDSPEAVRIKTP